MKKSISVLLSALFILFSLSGCAGTFNGIIPETKPENTEIEKPTDTEKETEVPPEETPEINVRPAEWASVQWEQYSCAYFTLKIPVGWQVSWDGNAQKLLWRVTSPDGKIGLYNLDHDYAAKDPSMTSVLGFQKPLYNASVQGYFEMVFEDTSDYFTVQNTYIPVDKGLIQSSSSKQIRDYSSLYATFKDSTVGEGEGLYSAIFVESNDIYIRGSNYGTWEIDAIFSEWAPLGQLVNWAGVLSQIAESFAYTDYYIEEWQSWLGTTVTPTSSTSDTDPVMEAFEERSKSDTIIQEKRSDMLEEYDRVYDNETGEIYRAYSGFLDDIGEQSRYTPITDSQYADGYVGWIDK